MYSVALDSSICTHLFIDPIQLHVRAKHSSLALSQKTVYMYIIIIIIIIIMIIIIIIIIIIKTFINESAY